MNGILDCRECRSFTRTPSPAGPHAFLLTCDLRSPEFPRAEFCPCYRPPPKPAVVREPPGGGEDDG